MHTTINPQLGLLDCFMPSAPANAFLQTLATVLAWRPIERVLQAMYPATTGRPPCAPLVLFKMSRLQHGYGLSDPQCEALVGDRLSWRRFVGLGLQDAVPDATTLVRFRQRLRDYGRHEKRLVLVNRQLAQKGLILKTCTLVDATLLQTARRAPGKADPTGGDGGAGYTVKRGQPHDGDKAHVAVDATHTLIRAVTLTAAPVHDRRAFETVVKGDETMVVADKAYWRRARSAWCGERGIANGLLRQAVRGEKLKASDVRLNQLFSSIRCKIEKVFGWWKRSAGYRRVRDVGRAANRLELAFKSIGWHLKRLVTLCGP